MNSPINLHFSMIKSRTETIQTTLNLVKASSAFIHLMLDAIYPTKSADNFEIITDGGQDRGIDAIYIRDSNGHTFVDIMSFKYKETLKSANKNFEENEIVKIFSFLNDIHQNNLELFKGCNQGITNKVKDIHEIFKSGGICYFKIILCSNGQGLSETGLERLDQFSRTHPNITYEEIDIWGIVNLIIRGNRPQETASFDVTDRQIFDRADGDIKGIIANVDAISFLKAIVDQKTKSIKRYLFEENIRVFLGEDGGYNRQIMNSALSSETHLFWYQNNGITIVCDSASYQQSIRNPVVSVTNFQIVNGAQTCHSLYEAFKKEPEKISSVLLLVRIYETKRTDIANKVAIATNSQARTTPRDLRSNDEVQKKISEILIDKGYFYERKKNEHTERSASLRLDALKLGQAILAYIRKEPERARTQSDDIFGSRYNEIFNHTLDDRVIHELTKLIKEVERRREMSERAVTSETGLRTSTILSYGFWHILFVISVLLRSENRDFPNSDEFDKYFDLAVDLIDRVIKTYKSASNYDMFRSQKLREKILTELDIKNIQMSFEFLN